MKNKKFQKGNHCAFCGDWSIVTREHVIPNTILRSFNTIIKVDPIIIPTCKSCNTNKGKYESYMGIILALSSGIDLTSAQEKELIRKRPGSIGPNMWERTILSAQTLWGYKDNLYQKMAGLFLDWEKLKFTSEYIAKGLIYYHNGNLPIRNQYNKTNTDCISQNDFDKILSNSHNTLSIVDDKNHFGDYIKYKILFGKNKDIVLLKIFNPRLGNLYLENFEKSIFKIELCK